MDNKRHGRCRPRSSQPIRFVTEVFDRELRRALEVDSDRPIGQPGTDPNWLSDTASDTIRKYLISSLLSKYDPGDRSSTLVEVAMEKFWEAEERCFFFNLKFSQPWYILDEDPVLVRAREEILRLLGHAPPLDPISRQFGFSSGASTRQKKTLGDAAYKYSADAEVTPNAYCIAVAAISCNPIWKQMYGDSIDPPRVWGSRITTVPKNYKTDRVIAIEPCLNMYVQRGLGRHIRRRLKTVGIDLNDQTANQRAARDLENATIDFSMASDLVSQGLVNYLLPPLWVDLISSMRSEMGVLPSGELIRYNKVSSMGNGFTFELESLIFWALARAVVPAEEQHRILVYGDDVVIPRQYAVQYQEACRRAGFLPNADKSYWDGPFRESCGKHYYRGYDVTPFYLRRPVRTLPDLFLLHNNLLRWTQRAREVIPEYMYEKLLGILKSLRNLAPAKWRRPRLPDGFGDGAFIGSFAEVSPRPHRDGWEYFEAVVLAERMDTVDFDGPGLLVKTELNMRKRRLITGGPVVRALRLYEIDGQALPVTTGRPRSVRIAIPWSGFG